jgi:hypothetical protein
MHSKSNSSMKRGQTWEMRQVPSCYGKVAVQSAKEGGRGN